MSVCALHELGRRSSPPLVVATGLALTAGAARADDAIKVSVTIADRKFDPAELHAPPGKGVEIKVKNLNSIATR